MVEKRLFLLLADDDKDDYLLFKEALDELSVAAELTTVPDGDALTDLLFSMPNEHFDVLFLDLNMPRKNGFACLEEIKANEELKDLPVIVFSTSFEKNIEDSLYEKGAHLCICKPSDFLQLKKLISAALQSIQQGPVSKPSKEAFLLRISKQSLT